MKCIVKNAAISGVGSFVVTSFFFFCFLSCEEKFVQPQDRIAEFPGNKSGAITFTFDDGPPSTFTEIVPLCDVYSFKATFFIAPALIDENKWVYWKELRNRGFEVGNHSMNHLDLTQLTRQQLAQEINEAFDVIKQKTGTAPRSFAPPGHRRNAVIDSVVFLRHEFSRTTPPRTCRWHGWMTNTKAKEIRERIRKAIVDHEWYVVAAHGVNDGWEPVSTKMLEEVFAYVHSQRQNLAIDTFESLAAYLTVRERCKLIVTKHTNAKHIELSGEVPESLAGVPLTVVLDASDIPMHYSIHTSRPGEVFTERNGNTILLTAPANTITDLTW